MAEAYRITQHDQAHFMTCTVTDWIDIFTRRAYADIVLASLEYCIRHKGLDLHAWCLMPNHLHLIASAKGKAQLPDIVRDFKRHTAKSISQALFQNKLPDSRRDWMLRAFYSAGGANPDNEMVQVWQPGYHPVLLEDRDRAEQRLNYLHDNPVRSGLVREPWDYRYSSAIDYFGYGLGMLPLALI